MVVTQVRAVHVVAALLSLVLVFFAVMRVSSAAFSDATQNTGSQWTAGDVVISDDDASSAMFAVTNMKPGQVATKCIAVTYTGSLDAAVKLFGATTAGDGLETYLDLTVERGTPGNFAGCGAFSATETVYTGTLAGFLTDHTAFAGPTPGAGTWAPTGGAPDDAMTYKFTVTLQDDNAAQTLTTTTTFTWEAQNT
jgi:hypothetical protein